MAKANVDYVLNGRSTGGAGSVADRLIEYGMDPNAFRPWIDKRGRTCQTVFNHKTRKFETKLVTNAPNTGLMKNVWMDMDDALARAARPKLKIWNEIRSQPGLSKTIPDGMGVTVLQFQNMSDAGEAMLSMDPIKQTYRDRPEFNLDGIPLPIVHSDFSFTAREIRVSQRQRMPLDTTMLEQATRKCTEKIEQLIVGSVVSFTYAGYTVYGLQNYPYRLTKTFTAPTSSGWTPQTLVDEMLDAIQSLQDIFFNGPYGVWYSPGFMKYMNADYSAAYPNATTMTRLRQIEDIKFFSKADYLTGFTILIVQLTPDVIQAVQGMKLTNIQWDTVGGMEKNFKVLGMMVPLIRRNSDDDTGICECVGV